MSFDEQYMQQCIALAGKGLGRVQPNPLVGAVIVHHNRIIAEGYHQQYGAAHAEVEALEALYRKYPTEAPSLLAESTLYVNLEPCSHQGKTPPCADRIIKEKIKKVVIANIDPFSAVNGNGITRLQQAGLEVKLGVLKEEGEFLNRRFFTYHRLQRPFVILKWAESADGFMNALGQQTTAISSSESQVISHQWRSEEQSILVGTHTALIDNPHLTTRAVIGRNPVRLVIDRNLKIPKEQHLFDSEAKTIVFNDRYTGVEANIQYVQIDFYGLVPQFILYQLYLMEIQSVIVEGGSYTLQSFLQYDLWDEIRIIESPKILEEGLKSPVINGTPKYIQQLETDKIRYYHRL